MTIKTVCGDIFFDVNGSLKPNTIGKDIFNVAVVPNGIKLYSSELDCENKNAVGWGCLDYILKYNKLYNN